MDNKVNAPDQDRRLDVQKNATVSFRFMMTSLDEKCPIHNVNYGTMPTKMTSSMERGGGVAIGRCMMKLMILMMAFEESRFFVF